MLICESSESPTRVFTSGSDDPSDFKGWKIEKIRTITQAWAIRETVQATRCWRRNMIGTPGYSLQSLPWKPHITFRHHSQLRFGHFKCPQQAHCLVHRLPILHLRVAVCDNPR